jgi:hypothetical protein
MEKLSINKSVVVESPRDVILDAVVVEANKTTWAEIISPDKLHKFDDPNKALVQIKFETSYNNEQLRGEDTFNFFEKPMSNSKMGLYLVKYDEIRVGQTIKVIYNKDGFPKIKVD